MNRWTTTLTLAALLLAGCEGASNEPLAIDRASAALTATTNVKSLVLGASDALARLQQSSLLETLGNALGGGGMTCAAGVDEQGNPLPEVCSEEPVDLDLGLEAEGERMAKWLEAAVFDPSEVESEDGSTLLIRLKPEVFCAAPYGDETTSPREPTPAVPAAVEPIQGGLGEDAPAKPLPEDVAVAPVPEEEVDPCVDFLTKVPVRLRFTSTAEGEVSVDVLFGQAQIDPADLILGPDHASVTVGLAEAKAVWQVISDAWAADGEVIEVPQVIEGSVRVGIEQGDDGAWTLTGAVVDPVTLDKDLNGQHSRLTVAASQISATATADGKVATLAANVGAVALSIPYQWMVDASNDGAGGEIDPTTGEALPAPEPPQVAGNLDFALPAFTGAVTFDDDLQALSFAGVGLPAGAFTLERDGARLASLALNTGAGGVADALVDLAGQNARVTVSPLFDLVADLHLAPLAAELSDLPSFVQDETLRVLFDQALAPTFEIRDHGVDEALAVTAGTLTFSSTAAPDQTVTVAAGACLTFAEDDQDQGAGGSSEAAETAEHEILSSLVSGACAQ